MISLPLAWTLLTVSLWTSGLGQSLQQETINIRYPEILSTETIDCDCVDTCKTVYWYRISDSSQMQFLGKCNNADFKTHGEGVDQARFILSRKTSSMSFTLRIINVTEKDTGIYSCVLEDKKHENGEIWRPGVYLRPGASPPTLPPKTKPKPPVNPVCRCPKKNPSRDGCSSLILWPLVGLIGAVALALICVLYYFSRLPKKCRHRFAKKR